MLEMMRKASELSERTLRFESSNTSVLNESVDYWLIIDYWLLTEVEWILLGDYSTQYINSLFNKTHSQC